MEAGEFPGVDPIAHTSVISTLAAKSAARMGHPVYRSYPRNQRPGFGSVAHRSVIPTSRAKSAREMGHPDILSNHGKLVLPVNSSHHQSADAIGDGLRIVARCPADGIIEGLEGTDPDHFVVAVQWHPERSIDADEASRAIFRALIEKATVSG